MKTYRLRAAGGGARDRSRGEGRSELDSVMRLIDSRLELSLARLLTATAPP